MIIKKVEVKKDKVKISLSDGSDFIISIEAYLNNKILLNEEISEKEIDRLKKTSEVELVRLQLLKKITRKKLSKYECKEFLIGEGINKEDITKIINEFEKNYLINDLELGEFIVDYALLNKKGINYIYQKLKERNVDVNIEVLVNDYLDIEKYQENIKYQIKKYTKLANNKSKLVLKNYLINKMKENGYNSEEFMKFIDVNDIDEKIILVKEINKFFTSREVNEENIAKIIKKLLSKGFNYAIIKEAIRECELNETY